MLSHSQGAQLWCIKYLKFCTNLLKNAICTFIISHGNTNQINNFILKECQANKCPGIPNTCQVGFLPVVSVPDGKCCPELKCGEFLLCCLNYWKRNEVNPFLTSLPLLPIPLEPKRVCVHKDIEYQVKTKNEQTLNSRLVYEYIFWHANLVCNNIKYVVYFTSLAHQFPWCPVKTVFVQMRSS